MVVLAVQDARWLHGTGKFPGGCVEIKQAWWCWPYRMLDGFTALGSFPAAVWRSNRHGGAGRTGCSMASRHWEVSRRLCGDQTGMVVLAVQDARWLHGTGKFPGGCVEIKPSATDYIFLIYSVTSHSSIAVCLDSNHPKRK
ncbi:hypothetical protein Vretifemale_8793 [Volvox reticuliferus]|uniref:Uncharacterized protein n=1 Tax=Volvox reticuliferus TaxID=1737510 RepID=A0A8J4CEL4_9CHLO|nr:hypothetical protein Vretifemale_8793 [Volvox reticuliferus]